MTVTDHPAVGAYLARFDALAAHLPQHRRDELRADLVEHLQDALPDDADHGAVDAALARLGAPEDIVAAASEGPVPPPPAQPRPRLVLENFAVAFLTLGAVILPFVGWLVGVVLLWASGRWTTREKLLGTLVFPGGPLTPLAILGFGGALVTTELTTSCQESDSQTGAMQACSAAVPVSAVQGGAGWGALLLVALVVLFLLPFAVGIVLMRRVRSRSAR